MNARLDALLANRGGDLEHYRMIMDAIKDGLKINPDDRNLIDVMEEIACEVEGIWVKCLISLDYEGCYKLGTKEEIRDNWSYLNQRRLLLFQMSLVETMQDRLDLLEAQRRWGLDAIKQLKIGDVKLKVRQKLNNKTRIGIMGAHFGKHYVGAFIKPLVEHINLEKFELFCYSFKPQEGDAIQQYIAAKADSLKLIDNRESNQDVAQSIADDGLDVLIETGTFFHRSGVTVYKPAPVIISWLDYPNSSGLPVDYMVMDPYTNPADENLLLEKPMLLPKTWVVIDENMIRQTPMDEELPQDRNGYLTFGSMSRSFKITREVFKVWAEIMHMVPNSKFLYVGLEVESLVFQANFCKYMKEFGITVDRLILIYSGISNVSEYYSGIDIVLDTFPRTGGTTTCEALWMGVPVVSLVGPALYERISYSNLSNAALGDLCAFTPQEYKDIAIQLAQDKERRRYLRHNLRQQILNNPLGKPKEFAIDMGSSILKILNRD